jgi:hypothetical protein
VQLAHNPQHATGCDIEQMMDNLNLPRHPAALLAQEASKLAQITECWFGKSG